jgi:hypothetical protein
MTRLNSKGHIEEQPKLNDSVDIDEEDPIIQTIQETPPKKNYRVILLMGSFSLIVIGICISLGIMIGLYINSGEDGGDIKGGSEMIPEMQETNMEAHFTNWKSHKKHKHKSCSDKFGCCEIVFGCENKTKYSLPLSPYRIMKDDKEGSNCPKIDSLAQTYNEKFHKQCVIDGCKTPPTDCPNVYGLVDLYNTNWYDPGQDMAIISIIFMIIISMIGIYCCHIQCFEKCPYYRNHCNQK